MFKYKINQSAGYLDEINHKDRGVSVKITSAEVPKIDEILIAAAFILIVGQQLIINAVPVSNLLTSIFFKRCFFT